MNDLDLWLVLASLVITTIALGRWINRAGDEWLQDALPPRQDEIAD